MARVTGPLQSQEAHGSFANLLTFAGQLGRTIVKRKSSPTGDPTPKQESIRLSFLFMQQAFGRDLTDADRLSWAQEADQRAMTEHNRFSQMNLTALAAANGPRQNRNINTTDLGPTFTIAYTPNGGAGITDHHIGINAPNQAWLAEIRQEIDTGVSNRHAPIVHIFLITSPGSQNWHQENLAAGNYRNIITYYRKSRPETFTRTVRVTTVT